MGSTAMLRALVFSALVALSLAADFPPLANNGSMEFISFRTTRQSGVRCGQQFSVIAQVRLNSFGDADNLYCAIQQVGVNNRTNKFKFKERINRFKNVNTRKFELNFGEDNPVPKDGSQKFWWTWAREGRLWSEGVDYTLKIVTVLNNATLPESNWQFYCETKKLNTASHYYWPKNSGFNQKKVRVAAPCAQAPPKLTARGPKQK